MIKKILDLDDKEKLIYYYSARPFIIYAIFLTLIVCIGSTLSTLSPDMIDGYICSMLLCFVINYLNLRFTSLNDLEFFNIKKYLVEKPDSTVTVTILRNKSDNTYSYVNLTNGHICPCRFKSIDEALHDMDVKIENGDIIKYRQIN